VTKYQAQVPAKVPPLPAVPWRPHRSFFNFPFLQTLVKKLHTEDVNSPRPAPCLDGLFPLLLDFFLLFSLPFPAFHDLNGLMSSIPPLSCRVNGTGLTWLKFPIFGQLIPAAELFLCLRFFLLCLLYRQWFASPIFDEFS